MKFTYLCLFAFIVLASAERTFKIGETAWLKDGEPYQIISASVHYFRIQPDYWEDIIKKVANAGFNTIQTYFSWNLHEPKKGEFHFEGMLDIDRFFTLIEKYNLTAIARPGPYICGEWEFGGFPYWLLKEEGIKLRSSDPKYVKHVDEWFDVLLPILNKHLYVNGGSILLSQVENEYGSYPVCDHEYVRHLLKKSEEYFGPAFDSWVPFTTDGPSDGMVTCGTIDEVYTAVDFGPGDAAAPFALQRKYQKTGPNYNSEYYPGWLDHWNEPHQKTSTDNIIRTLDQMVNMNATVNFYVFIGGTNFGFLNGANGGGDSYTPDPTSYDYDAPLSEAGDMTYKYQRIAEYLRSKFPHSDYPVANTTKVAYGKVEFSESISLWDALEVLDKEPTKSENTLSFETLDVDYGYVLYETVLPSSGSLTIKTLRDRAHIYVGHELQGILTRSKPNESVKVSGKEGETLYILVENQGRLNYGGSMTDPKGILGGVYIDGKQVFNWIHHKLTLRYEDVKELAFAESKETTGPRFYVSTFDSNDVVADTFFNPTGWTKGVTYINGNNIGRYWTVGPQLTLYTPRSFITKGLNEVIVFEMEKAPEDRTISFDDVHVLDMPIKN
ncbi:hypothetical protein WA158_008180 [Blastocystis sp. Blastoise]